MRVLQINSVCGVGSTGRIATDLYKVLEEQGHECLIAYGRGTAPEGINAYKIGTNLDNYLHVARTRLLDQHGYGSKKPTIELVKKIKEYNPDVIHLHNLHGYYVNLEILFNYLAESNKPVVWTLHDCWAVTGHCAHFDYVGCYKWQNQCNKCPQKRVYPASYIDKSNRNFKYKQKLFSLLPNLTVITVSKWLENIAKKSFLSNHEIITVYNGINMRNFFEINNSSVLRKYNIQIDKKKIILGVSNVWGEKKGLMDFIRLSEIIDDNCIIVLVGITEELKNTLPSNVIGIPRTENLNELNQFYSCADVFVNLSVEETFGLVTVEAMACGTPVIVYNSTGCPELVPIDCGYVVEKNNIKDVKVKIDEIFFNGREYYSENCKKNVRKNYESIKNFNEMISLYKRLCFKKFEETIN